MTGPVSEEMKKLQAQISGAWAAFARTGNPNHAGLPDWPAYTEESKAVMLFDAPSRVEKDPGAALRKLLVDGPVPER